MGVILNPYTSDNLIPLGNLVAYLRFNNSVADQSGNHSPTSNGVTYVNGLFSLGSLEAVYLNDNSDYIQISDDGSLSFTNGSADQPFSITTLMEPLNLGVVEGSIYQKFLFSKRGSGSNGDLEKEYQFTTTNASTNHKLFWSQWDQSSGGRKNWQGSTNLVNSTKYHIGVSTDGTNMQFYVDAVAETMTPSSSGTYTCMENLGAPFKIGSTLWGDQYGLQAYYDGFAIWDIGLSQEQMTAIKEKQYSGQELL